MQALQRLDQAAEPNVMFAGDMNWNSQNDGAVPLPPGWCELCHNSKSKHALMLAHAHACLHLYPHAHTHPCNLCTLKSSVQQEDLGLESCKLL